MDYNVWYLPDNTNTYKLHMLVPLTEAAKNATECTPWLVNVAQNDIHLILRTTGVGLDNGICITCTAVY